MLRQQSLFLVLGFASSAHAQEASVGEKVAPAATAVSGEPTGLNQGASPAEVQYFVQESALYGVVANGRQRIPVEGEATAVLRFGNLLYVGFGSRGVNEPIPNE